MQYITVTPEEFADLEGLEDWRFVLGSIHAHFRTGSFPAAAALVLTIADAAETAQHHPDIDMRYPDHVRVTLKTHAARTLTTHDVLLAREISRLAAHRATSSEPVLCQGVEIAIDTIDERLIRPFWTAILGYRDDGVNLVDPLRIGPTFWFQQMQEPRVQRDRLHIDVSVPHDQAEGRIVAALAAGGRLLSADFARSWWILADADGNEACVCTWQDRAGK